MLLRLPAAFASIFALAAFTTPVWSATTLDQSEIISASSGLGPDQLNTYGQTFTVGNDSVLTNFTFFDSISAPGATFQLTVADWNGTEPGSVLFTSAAVSTPFYNDYHIQPFNFSTENLHLVTGKQYVAYLQNASGLGQTVTYLSYVQVLSQFQLPAGSNYTGGSFVRKQQPGSDWIVDNDLDASFKARFIEATPEPSAILIFLVAFSFLMCRVIAMHRRNAIDNR